jgi:hypothetical protein
METNKNSRPTANKQNSRFNSFNARNTATPSKPAFQAKTPLDNAKKDAQYAVKNAAGKYVKFEDTGEYGLLVGAAMHGGWPTYVVVDRDRKVKFVEVSHQFNTMDYDINLSILNYLRNNEPEFIEELAKDAVDKSADPNGWLTRIVVKRQVPNQDQRNNNGYKARKAVKKSK